MHLCALFKNVNEEHLPQKRYQQYFNVFFFVVFFLCSVLSDSTLFVLAFLGGLLLFCCDLFYYICTIISTAQPQAARMPSFTAAELAAFLQVKTSHAIQTTFLNKEKTQVSNHSTFTKGD